MRTHSNDCRKKISFLFTQCDRNLPSVRRGEKRQFRLECSEDLPFTEDPEASSILAEPETAAVRDAAYHG